MSLGVSHGRCGGDAQGLGAVYDGGGFALSSGFGLEQAYGGGRVCAVADSSLVFYYNPAIQKSLTATYGPNITSTRASNRTCVNSSGIIVTLANNVPCFDHDPADNKSLGFGDDEEARTNVLLHSNTFDNAVWTNVNSSVSSAAATSPDSTTNAWALTEDSTASAVHEIFEGVTSIGTSQDGTNFIYVKANTRSFCRLLFFDGVANDGAFFDLTAGTVGDTSGGVTAAIKDAGNGWHKISIAYIQDGSATTSRLQLQLAVSSTGSGHIYNGDGSSGIFIFSGEIDAASFPTSLIGPTTTSTVARAAGVNSADISSIVTPAGALLFSGRTGFDAGVLVQLDDGTENERVRMERNASNEIRAFITDGGVEQITGGLNLGTVADNTDFKAMVSYETNDVKGIITGGSEQTDTSATMPTTTTIRHGMDTSGDELNGWAAETKMFNEPKSSAFMAAAVA